MHAGEHNVRTILVTGSSRGIGAAIVERLAGPETNFVLHALSDREGCERTAVRAREAGARCVVSLGDLVDSEVAEGLVDTAVQHFDGLDVLIASAGFPDLRGFDTLDRSGLDYCYRVMTAGFFAMATRAIPYLRNTSSGRVITLGTHNSHVFRTHYPIFPGSGAAKAGLETLTRALAIELAPYNTTVNCVVPGFIGPQPEDEMESVRLHVPLGRVGRAEEVAALVAFLAGEDAAYITNQVIHVNGGLS